MNAKECTTDVDQWHIHIGRFALGLGGIEWATDMLLEQVQEGAKGKLGERLDRLMSAVGKLKPELQSEVVELIDEAHKIRKKRNTILHSTVAFNFYTRENDPASEILIAASLHDREGKHTDIDLSAMSVLAGQAEDLSRRFWAVVPKQYVDS